MGEYKMLMKNTMTENTRNYHQNTLNGEIDCSGIGVHSGKKISLKLCPAKENTGIVFVRTDLKENNVIQAKYDNVVDTKLCTVISNSYGASVSTIEHLMAALKGMEIDNLRIEIDGPEVPIMDGSSSMFIFLIECAGIAPLPALRRYIKIIKDVRVDREDAFARISPYLGEKYSFTLEYNHAFIQRQDYSIVLNQGIFKSELARARTYGFIEDVEMLQKAGLALGGSLKNAIVIDGEKLLNEEGLRYPNELVRHKTLDAIGDLYLAGYHILGHFEGHRSGHEMNNRLLREVFSSQENWRFVDPEEYMAEHTAQINNNIQETSLAL